MTSKPFHEAAAYERQSPPNSLPQEKAQDKPAAVRWEIILLGLWLIVNLSMGALTVHQYGVSFDEPNNYRYAADTLSSYKTLFGILYPPPYNLSYDGHGPVFVAGVSLVIRAIRSVFPTAFPFDLWHFSYFIAFQATGICLYLLMKRWFHRWTAWGILLLFDTQPLLLGHAFINPKDVPFMCFFTLSILLGFRLADRTGPAEQFVSLSKPFHVLTEKLGETEPRRRRRFLILFAVAAAVLVLLTLFSSTVNSLIDQSVRFFYRAAPDSWAGRVFGLVASHAHELAAKEYVSQAQRVFRQAEIAALLAGLLLFAIYFCISFPAVLRATWEGIRNLGRGAAGVVALPRRLREALNWRSLKAAGTAVLKALSQPSVIAVGVVLGLATSIRAVAPWAGIIAFLYLLTKARARAWATGIAYFLAAGIVTYVTWPRLWGAPWQRYWEGMGVISNFVKAQHVLFNGRVYAANELPRSYLFTLFNIQFTEPFLLCAYIGIAVLIWQILRNRVRTDLLLYITLGFAAPLVGWEMLGSPLYDNFRHLLFVIPALFMLAAFTLELVFRRVTKSWLRVLLIAAIALPGVYSTVSLYPYEYAYYNSLVGGVNGARKLYTMDPWRTSLREVALELNQRAPQGATVLAGDWAEILGIYTRPDLILETAYDQTADLSGKYDYAVDMSDVKPWSLHHATEDVFVVRRGDAVLATLRAVNNASIK